MISRIRRYCAKLGLTPEQTLASHMDSLDYFGKKYRIVFDQQIVESYREFLAGKRDLVITAKPRRLIDFGEISFYNSGDVPAPLNLEVIAK